MEELQIKWNNIRKLRNVFLARSDWTALTDCQLSQSKKDEWAAYRQLLRDVTLQTNPDNILWPNEPE